MLKASTTQKGNKCLNFLSKVSIVYEEQKVDFIFGKGVAGLFLSARFNTLHSGYFYEKVDVLKDFKRKFLVFFVEERKELHKDDLLELTRTCFLKNIALFPCFSHQDCADLIEGICLNHTKKLASIDKKDKIDNASRLEEVFRLIKVNKTDVRCLARNFGSLKKISGASVDQMKLIPGIGDRKAQKLHEVFNKKFKA